MNHNCISWGCCFYLADEMSGARSSMRYFIVQKPGETTERETGWYHNQNKRSPHTLYGPILTCIVYTCIISFVIQCSYLHYHPKTYVFKYQLLGTWLCTQISPDHLLQQPNSPQKVTVSSHWVRVVSATFLI